MEGLLCLKREAGSKFLLQVIARSECSSQYFRCKRGQWRRKTLRLVWGRRKSRFSDVHHLGVQKKLEIWIVNYANSKQQQEGYVFQQHSGQMWPLNHRLWIRLVCLRGDDYLGKWVNPEYSLWWLATLSVEMLKRHGGPSPPPAKRTRATPGSFGLSHRWANTLSSTQTRTMGPNLFWDKAVGFPRKEGSGTDCSWFVLS
jgi:hypothetical protein